MVLLCIFHMHHSFCLLWNGGKLGDNYQILLHGFWFLTNAVDKFSFSITVVWLFQRHIGPNTTEPSSSSSTVKLPFSNSTSCDKISSIPLVRIRNPMAPRKLAAIWNPPILRTKLSSLTGDFFLRPRAISYIAWSQVTIVFSWSSF